MKLASIHARLLVAILALKHRNIVARRYWKCKLGANILQNSLLGVSAMATYKTTKRKTFSIILLSNPCATLQVCYPVVCRKPVHKNIVNLYFSEIQAVAFDKWLSFWETTVKNAKVELRILRVESRMPKSSSKRLQHAYAQSNKCGSTLASIHAREERTHKTIQ